MKTNCIHSGAKLVMKIGTASIYAGGEYEIKGKLDEVRPRLIISLLGEVQFSKRKVTMTPEAKSLLPSVAKVRTEGYVPKEKVFIDWSDGSAPPVSKAWWQALVTDIANVNGNVIVFCMGGHGRTGTFLSILASLGGASGQMDPVAWVRKNYCPEAVETKAQIDYIKDLGIKTNANPTTTYTYYTGPSYGGFSYESKSSKDERLGENGKCTLCKKSGLWDADNEAFLCDDCWRNVNLKGL